MKYLITFLAALSAAACTPKSISPNPSTTDGEGQGTLNNIMSYEASEFEPTWSLRLIDGRRITFRQLDPDGGADFITESYRVKYQTVAAGGFTIHGANETGDFMFSALDISGEGGCLHSATGLIHRDKVNVASPRKFWTGCGGPEL
jgi:hypothetical protein